MQPDDQLNADPLPEGTRRGRAGAGARVRSTPGRRPPAARRRRGIRPAPRELGPLRVDILEALAHEIRTPMTTLYVAAKMLAGEDRRLPPGERSEVLDAVGLETERLYRLLEDFLAVVGAAGALREVREPVLVQHVVRGVIDELTPALGSRRIQAALPSGLPPVAGDADGLAHAARNMIERALDATPEHGVVDVVVRPGRMSVSVHVFDTGRRLAPDGSRAFAPFEGADAGSQAAPGRALGLAACRALVEAMGGRAWAAPGPESGTETGFALPLFRRDRVARTTRGHEGRPSAPGVRRRGRRRPARRTQRSRAQDAR